MYDPGNHELMNMIENRPIYDTRGVCSHSQTTTRQKTVLFDPHLFIQDCKQPNGH